MRFGGLAVLLLAVSAACAHGEEPARVAGSSEAPSTAPEADGPSTIPSTVPTTAGESPEPETTEPSTTTVERPIVGGQSDTQPDGRTTTAERANGGESKPETVEAPTTTTAIESSTGASEQSWGNREHPRFETGTAPEWPFHGLVQLWPDLEYVQVDERWEQRVVWSLRYWSWDSAAETYPKVLLPGLRIECLGQIAMVVHGPDGIEVGGRPGTANGAYWVDWDAESRPVEPSVALLEEVLERPSDLAVAIEGDWLRIGSGSDAPSYAMRDPVRSDGARWTAQARHSGELFLLTVQPAHLPCYSGVTWLWLAATGDLVACGANSAATAFVAPAEPQSGDLMLPDAEALGTYLSCAPRLDLTYLAFTESRELVRPPPK